MKIQLNTKQILADMHTPVSLYLKLSDKYPQVLLLESSDYSSKANSQSMLCFDLLSEITIHQGTTHIGFEDNHSLDTSYPTMDAVKDIDEFLRRFDIKDNHPNNGIFGYTNFDAVRYFQPRLYADATKYTENIPEIRYGLYRFVIVIDHFRDSMTILENCPEGQDSRLEEISHLIERQDVLSHPFYTEGKESPNMTDDDFMSIVSKCKDHCQRGDVFQIVPSRRFSIDFKGSEFEVYRHLRSINPSPYLFYFDYASYKVFGSSPEVQIKVEDGIAEIHPIAGTVKRSGDHETDQKAAADLFKNPKENAEHIMLVDLARNDLSRNCKDVKVEKYKEIQYFSHVIHLTSVVKGRIKPNVSAYQILADTFPAGTLSGAPKHKAISIIESVEPHHRGFYGGGIGMVGFEGGLNHAIMIRSFFSHNQKLAYQAGAGVVIGSTPEGELAEVNNKLAALKKAIVAATSHQNI